MARVIAALTVVVITLLVLLADPDHQAVPRAAARSRSAESRHGPRAHARKPEPIQAYVRLSRGGPSHRVPRSFLGLSTEYWGLPLFEDHMPLFERVLSLLRVPGDGPLVLRVGGDSTDHSFWEPRLLRLPPWAFALTPTWLRETGALVRETGIRLILDLNLVTNSPATAAQWARAAEATLPAHSIEGFEIGNEPDLYDRWYWRVVTRQGRRDGYPLPDRITASSYASDFHAYADALSRAAPRVHLLGPAVADPRFDGRWFTALLTDAHRRLAVITAHRYPYSACVRPTAPAYPTITKLLSEDAITGVVAPLARVISDARRARLPFRLSELNSVTCGGRAGVSDSFATALWAPDALFALLRAGVDGVNIHVRAHAINAAFVLDGRGLTAQPLLYGLIAFARTLGRDARLVPVRVGVSDPAHLTVWAVRVARRQLHLLLIDKGVRPVTAHLRVPGRGAATVQRLISTSLAPGATVTLAGQRLAADGRWVGARAVLTARQGPGGYRITVPGRSEALVSLTLRR